MVDLACEVATFTFLIHQEGSLWGTLATYATELAPVAGPLLDAVGQTAYAMDRAGRRRRGLKAWGSRH